MDIQPEQTQSISDDQELAKALSGVNEQAEEAAAVAAAPAAPAEPAANVANADTNSTDTSAAAMGSVATMDVVELDGIKLEALQELRPLVDKLDVSPEEKFDTYLLLLRSTDDKTLVAPAHEAAKNIVDEARRAQALLDIIKEIDFLSQPKQQDAATETGPVVPTI